MNFKLFLFFQAQSLIILCLFYIGLFLRKSRYKHVQIMATAIIWDTLLVLQIELNRQAILTATKFQTNALLLNIHLVIAISTFLLYFVQVKSGLDLLKGKESKRNAHKIIGFVLIVMRTLTFITSFFTTSFAE